MSAFLNGMTALHADPNRSVVATFTPVTGSAATVRVILSSPNDEFGAVRATARQATVTVAALGATVPAIGDALAIAGTTYLIADVEKDVLELSYKLSLAPQT